MDSIERMKNLINELNRASNAYYNTGETIMSDQEFDMKLEELKQMEKETSVVMSNSPTVNVGAEVTSELPKVKHDVLMLSLDKCHTVDEVIKFANNRDTVVSIKLDGLSTRAIYKDGELVDLITRGNGEEGTRVYIHKSSYVNLPLHINKEGIYIIDGETIINYHDFEEINSKLPDEEKYSNPRNLASGTLSLLDPSISKQRKLTFVAWDVIEGDNSKLLIDRFINARDLGFTVVPFWTNFSDNEASYIKENLSSNLLYVKKAAEENGLPCDGCVIKFNDVVYGKSLGRTDKFFRNGIAYKYEDESYPTELKYVEFTMGKTGILTPVAHFKPVQFPDSVVEKASLHNLSVMRGLGITNHCTCNVVKFNMIIPGVISCEDDGYGEVEIPSTCPICNGATEIRKDNESEVLFCTNPNCKGKLLGKLTHAVSRNALNIDGLSEATLETFIDYGWVNSLSDIYSLSDHAKEMQMLPGMGLKSVNKLMDAIEKSRDTTLDRVLYSLSIPLLGRSASKDISKYCHNSIDMFEGIMYNEVEKLREIDGIGDKLIESLKGFWNEYDEWFLNEYLPNFRFEEEKGGSQTSHKLLGMNFVITGKLVHFVNRDALVSEIQAHGGTVVGSVSKNTSALINNDVESTSGKNKKAKELGIPVWSEDELIKYMAN